MGTGTSSLASRVFALGDALAGALFTSSGSSIESSSGDMRLSVTIASWLRRRRCTCRARRGTGLLRHVVTDPGAPQTIDCRHEHRRLGDERDSEESFAAGTERVARRDDDAGLLDEKLRPFLRAEPGG